MRDPVLAEMLQLVKDGIKFGREDMAGAVEQVRSDVAAAFVVETRRADGDYVPERRFRALLPGGTLAYGATREEAEAAFWGAVEKEGGRS